MTLKRKGLINYIKDGKKDLVSLTEKGRKWNVAGTLIGDQKLGNKSEEKENSENNPSKLGNKSELNSENNPTNKNTNIYKSTNDKKRYAPQKPESVSDQIWNDLLILRKETKASNSKTAWTTVFNALEKAQNTTGHSLDQIITFWINKAWKGFNADWYLNAQRSSSQPPVNHQSSKPQRSTPDPLAVNAKYDVPSEMTDEQKRAWFADSTDGNTPSDTTPDNSHDYYYG